MELLNGTKVGEEENRSGSSYGANINNACLHQATITFVKSNLEGNTLPAQYSEEEIIPPPAPLRRLGSIGGIQTFGQKTFASLTLSFGPTSSKSSTKSTIQPVHKQEHRALPPLPLLKSTRTSRSKLTIAVQAITRTEI